ncbi:antibiotic biosynthesis monooxygenase [Amycolatopsis anabasis]|uniref:antibiotic biosynthesis monooxygenase n=1 Tax=Amycolatopsis anabasis TaxID=1840409 RepID=UPI00131D6F59|nr:antibiotic biosynthesis monooxygenase [Amycolatopsis anabasis]
MEAGTEPPEVVTMTSHTTEPDPNGPLAITPLVSLRDGSVLYCARWAGAAGDRGTGPAYRRYRGYLADDALRPPGCVVLVWIDFDRAGAASEFFDAVVAGNREAAPITGMIAAQLHISTDGRRGLTYGEWSDESAHQAALGRGGPLGPDGAVTRHIRAVTGVRSFTFQRYRPYRAS